MRLILLTVAGAREYCRVQRGDIPEESKEDAVGYAGGPVAIDSGLNEIATRISNSFRLLAESF